MNTYQLIAHGQTSGWDAARNDVNTRNEYQMLPIEVAAQAGNVDEFRDIMNAPEFDPIGARPRFFAEVGRRSYDEEARYTALQSALDEYRVRFH
ncbi:hypothetical protein G3O06_03330 [Burkholderia sp. Ac-20345]|uniref:hypothetical protein n=1 Tax=Burkholderia sp. Ac-20345 TaxID=2703891 RepID=UPI00197BA8A8|nr:hypothetical protein [Burkholderia sp. Ac-20345]MBN3776597.1 hypothetical protein [Burkholderia sp. Ac-20345]